MHKFFLTMLLAAMTLSTSCFAEKLDVGDIAPNWMLTSSTNDPVFLYNEAEAGKTTVMVFWASWCQRCERLLPKVDQLKIYAQEQNMPIKFYALNVWEEDDPVAYLRSRNISLDIIPGAEQVAKRFNVKGTPGVIVVGSDKRIQYIRSARRDIKKLTADLKKVLKIQS